MDKKSAGHSNSKSIITIVAQLVVFVTLLLLLPLWKILFPYVSTIEHFNNFMVLIFLFGLFSQSNYLFQSFILIAQGGKKFVRSPLIFIALFIAVCAVLQYLDQLDFLTMLFAMLIARVLQLVFNLYNFVINSDVENKVN